MLTNWKPGSCMWKLSVFQCFLPQNTCMGNLFATTDKWIFNKPPVCSFFMFLKIHLDFKALSIIMVYSEAGIQKRMSISRLFFKPWSHVVICPLWRQLLVLSEASMCFFFSRHNRTDKAAIYKYSYVHTLSLC